MAGCGNNALLTLQYLSHALLFVTGTILIGLCALWDTNVKQFNGLIDFSTSVEVYILLGIGAMLTLMAFFGIFATMTQSYCLLIVYSSVVTLALLAKVVIAIILLIYGTNPIFTVGRTLLRDLIQCEPFSPVFEVFNQFQIQLGCCGVDGAYDYRNHLRCWAQQTNCYETNYHVGCAQIISQHIGYYSSIVGTFAVGTSVLEIMGCIISCTLTIWVKKQI